MTTKTQLSEMTCFVTCFGYGKKWVNLFKRKVKEGKERKGKKRSDRTERVLGRF